MQDILQELMQATLFNRMTDIIKLAGMEEQLHTSTYTIFAPIDAAFSALTHGSFEEFLETQNKSKLIKFLNYYLVPGKYTIQQLAQASPFIPTRGKNTLAVTLAPHSAPRVQTATITTVNCPCLNGYINIVNALFLPLRRI